MTNETFLKLCLWPTAMTLSAGFAYTTPWSYHRRKSVNIVKEEAERSVKTRNGVEDTNI